MADLTFAQSSRRNYTAPVLVAIVLLSIVGALIYRHMAMQVVTTKLTDAEVFPIRVLYKQQQQQGFKVVEKPKYLEEGIYVLATVKIDNHLTDPLFLKDFHVTLTTQDGDLNASAIEQTDLPAVTSAFPELTARLSTPLLRETSIPPGHAAEGTVILQFPTTQAIWAARKSAVLTIDLYHQASITIPFTTP